MQDPRTYQLGSITARSSTFFAAPGDHPMMKYRNGIRIQQGWFPWVVEILAVVALAYALSGSGRTKRWWLRWVPVSLLVAAIAVWAVYQYIDENGLAGDPAPNALWFWVGISAAAIAVLVLGWRGQWWGRRAVALLAVPLSLLSVAIVVNQWVGYYQTLEQAWDELTAGALPNQVDASALPALQGTTQTVGRVVAVNIPNDASHFTHRAEYVYLPPAWFASKTPPRLPVVMMIGGEFDTPSHWIRVGDAAQIADKFAAEHGGNTPIMVFVDTSGSFNTDSECVNGPRGNSEDHLVKDVPPYIVSVFGASAEAEHWGVVGWSMGGTCAVNLSVRHPDLFSGFVDIAGDIRPSAGDEQTTIKNLFGGDVSAYQSYAPINTINAHGRYTRTAGWFQTSSTPQKLPKGFKLNQAVAEGNDGFGGRDPAGFMGSGDYLGAARKICDAGSKQGIECAVIAKPGRHTWAFASTAFHDALPWLAGYLGTPGVSPSPLPASTPATR
nr:alpha/beta hydrolase-fold protein [Segniliparus rotundus]